MNYFLMHKDNRIASLEIDEELGKIISSSFIDKDRIPYCIDSKSDMQTWWRDRAISKSRKDIAKILKDNNISTSEKYLMNNLGLSVSDCYWICPKEIELKSKDVNFFENDFDKIGIKNEISKNSPSASTGGEMEKYWTITNKERQLIKIANSEMGKNQCVNEVFGTFFHSFINRFPVVKYSLSLDKNNFGEIKGVICKSFTNNNVEFIPALYFLKYSQISSLQGGEIKKVFINNVNKITRIEKKIIEDFLSYLLITDFLISNIDRHLNNFGLLRNPDTLEYIGFAPIFDNGNSMMFKEISYIGYMNLKSGNLIYNSMYDKEEKILRSISSKIENLQILNYIPDTSLIYKFYKEHFDTNQDYKANLIAKAYYIKCKILKDILKGESVYNISKKRKQYSDWLNN